MKTSRRLIWKCRRLLALHFSGNPEHELSAEKILKLNEIIGRAQVYLEDNNEVVL